MAFATKTVHSTDTLHSMYILDKILCFFTLIYSSVFLKLYFKFWGMHTECAGYIGIHMPSWFAALINLSSTIGISPDAILPLDPYPPTGPGV